MPPLRNKYTPGLSASRTAAKIYDENRTIGSKDTQNRDYVIRKTMSYIEDGLDLEKALDKIMEDDIVKEFEYLKKNGIDIRNCFRNWVEKEIKRPRRSNERTR